MGQYFMAVNMDREEYIHPHAFGDGLKFREICNNYSGVLSGLAHLLKKTDDPVAQDDIVGSWSGCKIVLIGDYDSGGLYNIAHENYRDVSKDVIRVMCKDNYAKSVLKSKLVWHTLDGVGSLMADKKDQGFYREVFGDQN